MNRAIYKLAVVPALVVAVNFSAVTPDACHIHPPVPVKEPEPFQTFATLQECESANRKLYGGAGRCHCFADEFMKRNDIDHGPLRGWRFDPFLDRTP